MRQLASIQKIINLEPIEGADFIERASILGWHCVVKKGEFKVGDLAVYFEIDSLLPQTPEFEFMSKNGTKEVWENGVKYVGYRLKTVKLRKQISQGLALPLSILNGKKYPNDARENPTYEFKEGDDVTELMGIVKYEIPIPAQLAGKIRGGFPGFIPKTDETRLQTYPKILQRYKGVPFYVTEKVDGSSVTYAIKNGEFHVCSRNLDLLDDGGNTFWKVAREKGIEQLMLANGLADKIAIQGELVGEGVQKNPLLIKGQTVLFFNAYDFQEGRYLDFAEYKALFDKMKLEMVPILGSNYLLWDTVDEMVKAATFKSFINPNIYAEGAVWRPLVEMKDDDLGRLSFKVISPEYLLKHE